MKTTRKMNNTSLWAVLMLLFTTSPLSHAAAQPCIEPPSGLVSWWPGDGNFFDIVGSNDGNPIGGPTFCPGKVDQAFCLDGNDDVIDLGPGNIIGSGNAPFSVVFWMRPTAFPNPHYFPIRLTQDTQFFIALTRDSNSPGGPEDHIWATFRDQDHQWWIPTNLDSLVDQWTHVAVIYNGGDKADASSYEIFFNGIQLPFGTFDAQHVGVACNDNAIGSDVAGTCPGSNYAFFPGLLDEIQVFDRALSPAEVQTIYDAGGSGLCKPAPAAGNAYDAVLPVGGINWFDAKAAAESLSLCGVSGHLATITSAQENVFIFDNLLEPGINYWIGGFQPEGSPEPAGNWQWVTGEPFAYTNWAAGEPNNLPSYAGPDENGLHIIGSNGEWNDLNQNRGLSPEDGDGYGYIVEFEVRHVCGDGCLDAGELCDDGNPDNTDACLDNCTPASCGDGFVQVGVEECDDGNRTSGDGCSNTCVKENHAPVCGGAVATPSSLWPPNHQYAAVTITGVTDADGDPVTITPTSIMQDESLLGNGSGNFSPDATLTPLRVRVERNGQGNGRVYHIAFTAKDGKGESCAGSVTVCVPHDQGHGASCIDGGLLFNSL